MTLPTAAALYAVVENTWPPAAQNAVGPWTIRDGAMGGQRVSAASAAAPVKASDVAIAEQAMSALGQPNLFMIRDSEEALDRMLADAGYRIKDPVTLYACPTATLTAQPVAPVSAFAVWPPLQIMRDIWCEAGIGPGRLAVMQRAKLPKTAILARQADRAAGTAFVAIDDEIAMIHAIEVAPTLRRKGAGINMMRAAAHWAQNHGATKFSLAVTDVNLAANALYIRLGMTTVGHYRYRIK